MCKHCKYFREFFTTKEKGQCFVNPPSVFMNGNIFRTEVEAEDIACRFFEKSKQKVVN